MAGGIRLDPSEFLPGRKWSVNRYALHFAGDGNLEVWNRISRRLVWQSGVKSAAAAKMAMQEDGNLVIYDHSAKPLWASGTNGHPNAYLALQEDGNLVIYSQDKRPLWHTATDGR
jgi:hypothetical protein